jgi:hypothetical protein
LGFLISAWDGTHQSIQRITKILWRRNAQPNLFIHYMKSWHSV